MGMKKTHDAVFAGEKYTDREGNEKTRFINMGALFTRDDGSMTVKIEAIPVGFNGWINFYEPKADDGTQRGGRGQQRTQGQDRQRTAGGGRSSAPTDSFEDPDIPF